MTAMITIRNPASAGRCRDCCQRLETLPERHCCLPADSLIDTPVGPQRIDCLRPGDQVWGLSRGERVPTRIIKHYRAEAGTEPVAGYRLYGRVTLAACACLVSEQHLILASELDLPQVPLSGPLFDLQTDTGNYFCQGVLLSQQEPEHQGQEVRHAPL